LVKEFASERFESKLPISVEQLFSFLKSLIWLLLLAVTLPVPSASCESFQKLN